MLSEALFSCQIGSICMTATVSWRLTEEIYSKGEDGKYCLPTTASSQQQSLENYCWILKLTWKHLPLAISALWEEEKFDREKEIIVNFTWKRCTLNFKLRFLRCASFGHSTSLKDYSYSTVSPSMSGIL